MSALHGRRVVLGVSGGIAAYKAVDICRRLVDEGAHVMPVLTEDSLRQVSMLVAFAAVALTALHRGQEASTLRRGLESNREIGKAVGLLMALHEIDDTRAFEMLAKVSQEMNVKVAEVAAQVVRHHARESGKKA